MLNLISLSWNVNNSIAYIIIPNTYFGNIRDLQLPNMFCLQELLIILGIADDELYLMWLQELQGEHKVCL